MTDRPPRTLGAMASEAQTESGFGGLVCPQCQCHNFKVYGNPPSQSASVTIRYKSCRNCGHRILTSTVAAERIIRDVSQQDE